MALPGMICTIHGTEKTSLICPSCLGTLHNKIEGLTQELHAMTRERNHWKANHDNLVKVNAALKAHVGKERQAAIQALADEIRELKNNPRTQQMKREIDDLRKMLWKQDPPVNLQPGAST